jgi:hypothetical protein
MVDHPERSGDGGLEPTVGDQLRLADALRLIERAGLEELRQIAQLLARQAFVTHPAAIRYLGREAAANLGRGMGGSLERGEELVALLLAGGAGEEPGTAAP